MRELTPSAPDSEQCGALLPTSRKVVLPEIVIRRMEEFRAGGRTLRVASSAHDFAWLIRHFGKEVTTKFTTGAGESEDHLRGPVENLFSRFVEMTSGAVVVLAGEDRPEGLPAKPDYAVYVDGLLTGFIELKSPGKGANPARFKLKHDRNQWEHLKSLPNLLYSDGNAWGLYSFGELQGEIAILHGDVETAGESLESPDHRLATVLTQFLTWAPQPPRNARELALTSARLCRLLRTEVLSLLQHDTGLQALAEDWRQVLFPEATDEEFADGYAQTVTFALLLARVEDIDFSDGELGPIADRLSDTHTLVGRALDVLTDRQVLDRMASTLLVLVRVFGAVHWPSISKGDPENWLLFYEEFLSEYDATLRQKTGSYYTPNRAVDAMTRLVDVLLRQRLGRHYGLASPDVTIVDPAVGTGTFLFRIIDRIAETITEREGAPEVPAKLSQAASRLIGFELQTGPYAVAEFRLAEEYRRWGVNLAKSDQRLYLTDTLDDPYADEGHLAAVYGPIAQSRRAANKIKRGESILVVIGNPPYKERSRGEGGWVEAGRPDKGEPPIFADFIPPKDWGVGVHVKHLYNPYVFFWRWALWKVFEHRGEKPSVPEVEPRGVVALITVSGFLNGPGFGAMRRHLRRVADAIWIIDLSPEGHQPPTNTRVFKGVQQPICITIAVRDGGTTADTPAPVRHISLSGLQSEKFDRLEALTFDDPEWTDCPVEWSAPFLPSSGATWAAMPALDEILPWSGSGTMPGRTWIRSPSAQVLKRRWDRLIGASLDDKRALMAEHPTDRTVHTVLGDALPGYPLKTVSIADETAPCPEPIRVAYRSFDRQFIIPDKRLINRPNPSLWWTRSDEQVYLTALSRTAPTSGPAVTFAADPPDLDYYKGSFGGRVFPLWRDAAGGSSNVTPALLTELSNKVGMSLAPEDFYAYIAGIMSHPAYTDRFREELKRPGLRIPLTADSRLFAEAILLGQRIIWLHTFGERYADATAGRPPGPPRTDPSRQPKVAKAIPTTEAVVPDRMEYRGDTRELLIGTGIVKPVEPRVWDYEISGMHALRHWFGYRKREPEGRRSSALDDIVHTRWEPMWTTDLLDVLNVLTLLVDLEDAQANLLDQVCSSAMITVSDLTLAAVLPVPKTAKLAPKFGEPEQGSLLALE